ncbi:MAG: tRNA (adenosine(37)-N6)-threonylcarbamoyltransferase complex ATPase subunit type 1 TsaE [Candidatus Saccharibacteria bacterium]
MIIEVKNENEMKLFGITVGSLLLGGEIIELIGDVGSGKTTFVKGLGIGLGVSDNIQSPSFTINRVYNGRDSILLSHYDFYRLETAGIMADGLRETIYDPKIVMIVEWAEVVGGILPNDRLSIKINVLTEVSRQLDINSNGDKSQELMEKIRR